MIEENKFKVGVSHANNVLMTCVFNGCAATKMYSVSKGVEGILHDNCIVDVVLKNWSELNKQKANEILHSNEFKNCKKSCLTQNIAFTEKQSNIKLLAKDNEQKRIIFMKKVKQITKP